VKKLAALILALGLTTSSVMADTCQHTVASTGNTITTGSIEATNLNPQFLGVSAGAPWINFSGGTTPTAPFAFEMNTNNVLLGTIVNQFSNSTGYAAIPISGFTLSCIPFNAAYIPTPASYPYTADTNGIGGGILTFAEYKPTGAAITIGTLSMPNSPHNGPYVNSASVTLNNPYTPTQGSVITVFVSTVNAGFSQGYQQCMATANLG
jgi:hypothetical protein